MSNLPPATRTVIATQDDEGKRADRFLADSFDGMSRSRLKALIEDGRARRDGQLLREPAEAVRVGATYTLDEPAPLPATPQGEAMDLAILYEDRDLIVLDKPAGLVVHPAPGNYDGTLVNALIAHCGASLSGIGGVKRPGIVHRLDKDTTGLMVAAKNDRAHKSLTEQFADHGRTGAMRRGYMAFVWDLPNQIGRAHV